MLPRSRKLNRVISARRSLWKDFPHCWRLVYWSGTWTDIWINYSDKMPLGSYSVLLSMKEKRLLYSPESWTALDLNDGCCSFIVVFVNNNVALANSISFNKRVCSWYVDLDCDRCNIGGKVRVACIFVTKVYVQHDILLIYIGLSQAVLFHCVDILKRRLEADLDSSPTLQKDMLEQCTWCHDRCWKCHAGLECSRCEKCMPLVCPSMREYDWLV